MIDPALERQQRRFGRVARPFWKYNQRIAALDRRGHLKNRVLGSGRGIAIDQHRVDQMLRDVLPERSAAPVVGARDRSRPLAQVGRQTRPDQRKIAVTAVVAEINALRCVGCAAEPENARAGERPGKTAQGASAECIQHHGFVAGVAIIASRCRSRPMHIGARRMSVSLL